MFKSPEQMKEYLQTIPVRKLAEADRDGYKKWRAAREHHSREKIPDEILRRQLQEEDPDSEIYNDIVFVIKDGSNFIAEGQIMPMENPKTGKHYAELAGVYVEKPYRGLGLAQKIDTERSSWAEKNDFDWMQTHVASANIPSLALKLKEGWRITNVVADKNEAAGGVSLRKECANKMPAAPKYKKHQYASLADTEKLMKLTQSGWVGITMKNIWNNKSLEPSDWEIEFAK